MRPTQAGRGLLTGQVAEYLYRETKPKGLHMEKHYLYTNHKTKEMVKVRASDITEADKLYQAQTGIDPMKANHVGCVMEPIETGDPYAKATSAADKVRLSACHIIAMLTSYHNNIPKAIQRHKEAQKALDELGQILERMNKKGGHSHG